MQTLIKRIRERLGQSAYANESAISHGIVTPILAALGWDIADPAQMVPEYAIDRGRVDFALLGLARRPAVFIEVKQPGKAVDGDRQLFTYAFHAGVPLCVLTDGREWSFYLPSGHGSYEDRRVYLLPLDEREPEEAERVLRRYLAYDRVRDSKAFEAAQRDFKDMAGRRESTATIPAAWGELLAEPSEPLLDVVAAQTELMCGYRPQIDDVLAYLRRLKVPSRQEQRDANAAAVALQPQLAPSHDRVPEEQLASAVSSPAAPKAPRSAVDRTIAYTLLGQQHRAVNASEAMIDILRMLASRDPSKLEELADAVRTRKRNNLAHTPVDIHPTRPDLTRSDLISPGWYVGLAISNREKMGIIRAAAAIYGLTMPQDLEISLPNA